MLLCCCYAAIMLLLLFAGYIRPRDLCLDIRPLKVIFYTYHRGDVFQPTSLVPPCLSEVHSIPANGKSSIIAYAIAYAIMRLYRASNVHIVLLCCYYAALTVCWVPIVGDYLDFSFNLFVRDI